MWAIRHQSSRENVDVLSAMALRLSPSVPHECPEVRIDCLEVRIDTGGRRGVSDVVCAPYLTDSLYYIGRSRHQYVNIRVNISSDCR